MLRSLARCAVCFLQGEDGPTAVEYAVMLALIIVVCVAAITTLGTKVNAVYSDPTLGGALAADGRATHAPRGRRFGGPQRARNRPSQPDIITRRML